MQILEGKSVLPGIAIGRIHIHRNSRQQVKYCYTEDTAAEIARFERAVSAVMSKLEHLYEETAAQAGAENAELLRSHQMILQDESYLQNVKSLIAHRYANAEYAVAVTRDQFCTLFRGMDDEYMQARSEDIRDVARRIIDALRGVEDEGLQLTEPGIVMAVDLAPSEALQLDKTKVLGLVTAKGSVTSHTAILAKTYGIPALVSTGQAPEEAFHGRMAALDARDGLLYIEPDEETLAHLQRRQVAQREHRARLHRLIGQESVTVDGRRIKIYANVGSKDDIAASLREDAEGIGLFRSEFLYLNRTGYPTEEQQYEAYRAAVIAMKGRRVVIRTLDLGADKQVDYMNIPEEKNAAMGLRAIRFCLSRPELFKTQLRAILRAAACGDVAVLYPMITSQTEVRTIKALVEEAREELAAEGVAYGEISQGVMIETPAAALISDLLAEEADFFSIGTNDLTQYALAVDRENEALDAVFDPYHPAVLRMIAMTADNAHRAGIPCCICGELGADTALTKRFLEMGVDELSVAPESVLAVRAAVREINLQEG